MSDSGKKSRKKKIKIKGKTSTNKSVKSAKSVRTTVSGKTSSGKAKKKYKKNEKLKSD